MFPQVYGYYPWLAMDIGKVSLVKLLGRFVNAHCSPVILPVTTSVLSRGEWGHVHIFSIFSCCGIDFDYFLLFFQLIHDPCSPAALSTSWQTWSSLWPSPSASLGCRHLPLFFSLFTSSPKSCISFQWYFWKCGFLWSLQCTNGLSGITGQGFGHHPKNGLTGKGAKLRK